MVAASSGLLGPGAFRAFAQGSGVRLQFLDRYSRPDLEESLAGVFRRFSADNPGWTIEHMPLVGTPVEQLQKVQLLTMGSNPDLFTVDASVPSYVGNGWLEPLDRLVERDGVDLSHFTGAMLDSFLYRDSLWAIPVFANIDMIVYNKDLFDEAGVPYPPERWGDPTWTWDAMIAKAQQLTKLDSRGRFEQIGLSIGTSWYLPWRFGTDWVDENEEPLTETPEFIAFLREMRRIVTELRVNPKPGETLAGVSDPFLTGRCAMARASLALIARYAHPESGLRFGVAPWPLINGKTFAIVEANGLGMFKASDQKEGAWEFLRWIADPVHGAELASAWGRMHGSPGGVDRWEREMVQHGRVDSMAAVAEALGGSWGISVADSLAFNSPHFRAYLAEVINPTFERLLVLGESPEAVGRQAARDIRRIASS